jgi:hypothetical protein
MLVHIPNAASYRAGTVDVPVEPVHEASSLP